MSEEPLPRPQPHAGPQQGDRQRTEEDNVLETYDGEKWIVVPTVEGAHDVQDQ